MKFPQGNTKASGKAVMSSKVARTATSNNNVSQIRSSNESDTLLTTFGLSETTLHEIKKVQHQGEFINFKVML